MATPNPWINVVGVFAAVAAAATAWSQLGRHDELTKSYGLAARELATIEDLARRAAAETDLQDAVRNGEGAISREHTLWIAKRGDTLDRAVPWRRASSAAGAPVPIGE